jgi:CBS domain containing-hemolysin-like protein
MSLPLSKAKQLYEEGVMGAATLLKLKENSTRPIGAIVVLNNIANISGSVAVGQYAAEALGSQWIGAFSALMTLMIIVFSEIIPKTLGQRYAAQVCLIVARPISWVAFVLTPLLWLLEVLQSVFGDETVNTTNEAELRFLARAGGTEGVIEEDEAEMVLRVFEMNDRMASDIMTPRTALTFLRAGHGLKDLIESIRASQHSRIVVVGETLDQVMGVVLRDELLLAILDGQKQTVEAYARPALFVPETLPSDELLVLFQTAKQHLAVVQDDHGGLSGVVTLEDVLEVLTGEIMDETDRCEDLREEARLRAAQLT